jgi:hypothetical protein
MSLRYIVPLSFLLLLATASAAAGLLGYCGTSGARWWMYQEVYSRLRGIFYLTESLSFGPFQFASLLLLAAAGLVAFGRHPRTAFIANHVALVAVIYVASIDWKASIAGALPFAPEFSLIMASRLDWPLALAVILALASTAACHWQYLKARLGRPSAA